MKPYLSIPIEECNQPLVPIPIEKFVIESPHAYEKLGAKYGKKSPYFLRQGVIDALIKAQTRLHCIYPNWSIKIFDAYRPVEVQQFMVNYTFNSLLETEGLKLEELSHQQTQQLWEKVYQVWAIPSQDPTTPPPHSTGAAVDITLVDENRINIDMGGEIDELSPRSFPNYYAKSKIAKEQDYHHKRTLLNEIMEYAGFLRHPQEWWHFSLGDQMWVWQTLQNNPNQTLVARYGRLE